MNQVILGLRAALLLVLIACSVVWSFVGWELYSSKARVAGLADQTAVALFGDGKSKINGVFPKLNVALEEINQTSNIVRHSSATQSKQISALLADLHTTVSTSNKTIAELGSTVSAAGSLVSKLETGTLPAVEKTVGQIGNTVADLESPTGNLLVSGKKVLDTAAETESIVNQHLPAIAASAESVAASGDRLAKTAADVGESFRKEWASPKPWYRKLENTMLLVLRAISLFK